MTRDQADIKTLDLSASEVAELVGVDEKEVNRVDAIIALVQKLSKKITHMREGRSLSRAGLAKMMNLTSGRISQLESGQIRHAPSIKTLAEIAFRLGYEFDIGLRDRRIVERPRLRGARWAIAYKPQRHRSLARVHARQCLLAGSGNLTAADAMGLEVAVLGEITRWIAAAIAKQQPEGSEATLFPGARIISEGELEVNRLFFRD